VSANIIDLALVVLIIVFAVNGYRQGFLIGMLSFVGFFSGALLGLQLGPWAASHFTGDPARVIVSLLAVFGLAVVGQAITASLGGKLRGAIRSSTVRRFDDVGGAIVSMVAVAVVAWLVAVPLGTSSMPGLAKAVRNSAILGVVDGAMPDNAEALSDALRETVDTRGFPDVFGDLSPTRVREVLPPDPQLAASPVVQNARRSVVKVRGTAPSCSRNIEGSGFVYAPNRVMTNAHVVAGTKQVSVEVAGKRYAAKVVVYDPGRDIAVLYSPNLGAPVLRFAPRPAESGTDAIVVGFPLDGPFDPQAARVRDLRNISGPDIYDSGTVHREIYTIRALVRNGNSGGPLLSDKGEVLGVIFAAAADDRETGFAVTAAEVAGAAEAGTETDEPVATNRCV
jgi:S1-C subfamily serine protease